MAFAKLDIPLNKFLAKLAGTCPNWHSEREFSAARLSQCSRVFEALKVKLVLAPFLAHTDFSCQFILEIDANHCGLGTSKSIDRRELTLQSCIRLSGVKALRLSWKKLNFLRGIASRRAPTANVRELCRQRLLLCVCAYSTKQSVLLKALQLMLMWL